MISGFQKVFDNKELEQSRLPQYKNIKKPIKPNTLLHLLMGSSGVNPISLELLKKIAIF